MREEERLLALSEDCPNSKIFFLMMNTIIWNCRGALKPSFQASFRDLVANHDPVIFVVKETRLGSERAKEITDRLPFQGVIHIDSVGFACEIWFL